MPRSCWARMDGGDTGVVWTEERRGRKRVEWMKGRSREKLNIVFKVLGSEIDRLYGSCSGMTSKRYLSKPGTRNLNLLARLVRFMRIPYVEGSGKGVSSDLLEDTRQTYIARLHLAE